MAESRATGGRRKAREVLFRVLFEIDLTGDDPREVLEESLGRFRLSEDGRDHVSQVFAVWSAERAEIDAELRPRLHNWTLERLSGVTRAILRLASAELRGVPDLPAVVILDESVRLATRYGEDESGAFVNGVLDPLARVQRPAEMERETRR